MKQKTIATRHLRTNIAAGYVLILILIFSFLASFFEKWETSGNG